MLLHGWCIGCRKFRRVRVSYITGQTPTGYCQNCEEDDDRSNRRIPSARR